MGGGPLSGSTYQPVRIRGPRGARIALAEGDAFAPPREMPTTVGLFPTAVYRLRVTNLPTYPGVEVFPSIEVIDRLAPPPGQELRFPIPIELTERELLLAARGYFITRVVYVEDPAQALPIAEDPSEQRWMEAPAGEDPLMVADRLGRPVAILRIGGRIPDASDTTDNFLRGTPPWIGYEQLGTSPETPASEPAAESAARPPATGRLSPLRSNPLRSVLKR